MSLTWEPQPKQATFLTRSEDEALYGGAKGGGKTDALLFGGLDQIEKPYYKAVFFRRTYPQLQEVLDRSQQFFSGIGGLWSGLTHRWSFNKVAQPPESLSVGSSTYAFRPCEHQGDEYNYQGHEYHYMGFDQVEQFPENQYAFLSAQARTSRDYIRVYIRSSANPGGVGHGWVRRRFIYNKVPGATYRQRYIMPFPVALDSGKTLEYVDRTTTFIPATVYDNPKLLTANPGYLGTLMSLPDSQRRALLEGDWDAFEGQYFTEWRYSIHVCKPFRIPESWSIYISGDYGYTAPSSVHWWAMNEDKQAFAYRELYKTKLTYPELAKYIVKMTPEHERSRVKRAIFDPSIFAKSGHLGRAGAEEMREAWNQEQFNVALLPADNDRMKGWNKMHDALTPYKGKDRMTAKMQVFEGMCPNLIRTLPDQVHDANHPEDLDTDGEDHAVDDARYFWIDRIPRKVEPLPIKPEPATLEEKVLAEQKRIIEQKHEQPVDDVLGADY